MIASPAPLAIRDLTFGYRREQLIIDRLSETFSSGECVAITGESGRGKSTLLYMLGLLLRQRSGEVIVGGNDVSALGDRERSALRASHFGFVFQDAALDSSRTVLDNVCETALYRGQPRGSVVDRAEQLLTQFGVGVPSAAKPTQVSGGQAQRIALARALVHHPAVLLCDEPTGNLDEGSSEIVMRALREHANAGGAVIIVTHAAQVVAECDRELRL